MCAANDITTALEKETFVVQVQFRQNATWQGTITWTDEKKTRHFRSALEMLKLMDDAIQNSENIPGEPYVDWDK